MQASFEECCCTLEAARAAQRQPAPQASIPVPANALREKVQAASGSLRVAVSKAAVLLGGEASAEERAALSMLVTQAVLALCTACVNVKVPSPSAPDALSLHCCQTCSLLPSLELTRGLIYRSSAPDMN